MNRKRLENRKDSMIRVRIPLYMDNRITGKAVEANQTRSQIVRGILAKALDKV